MEHNAYIIKINVFSIVMMLKTVIEELYCIIIQNVVIRFKVYIMLFMALKPLEELWIEN